jgi:hypothetical protein
MKSKRRKIRCFALDNVAQATLFRSDLRTVLHRRTLPGNRVMISTIARGAR